MVNLETPRLLIRRLRLSDEQAMHNVFGDPLVMRYSDQGPMSPDWIRNWLERCLEDYERDPEIGPWALDVKKPGATIGYCGLFSYPDVGGEPEVEIGYRLARSAWGKGYATEAVTAVRDYAFDTLRLSRVIAMIDPRNAASIRVATKAGMQYWKDVMFEGYTHPDHVYVIRNSVTG